MKKNQAKEIREFILQNITDHPQDIVAVTEKYFHVTRTTVHRHLSSLIELGHIIKTGKTRDVKYALYSNPDRYLVFDITSELEEDAVWKKHLSQTFEKLPKNIRDICSYGFHEMFNNAIEHSQGTEVIISTHWEKNQVKLNIVDNGIGIFKKIKKKFELSDIRESILELSKGKVTTDPENHTGEGIFFTSRMFDQFYLSANKYAYMRNNPIKDWVFESSDGEAKTGTGVGMVIALDSPTRLENVFRAYTGETHKFDKTHLYIEMAQLGEESFLSRSQARRLLHGIEKFRHVILDFKKVDKIGQAFVDEVFRVFQSRYPEIQFEYINTNEDVKFMIERGRPV
ncbi:DUF4325 domain-containing protein [bacterium]|nr:DUF4325 domain-containing protein [bacterium]